MSERDTTKALIERLTGEIRREAESLDPAVEEAALARIRDRLARAEADVDAPGAVLGCDAIQQSLPAYLAGELEPRRRELIRRHLRECVPCRRALAPRRREGEVVEYQEPSSPSRRRWMTAAAVGALLLAGSVLFLLRSAPQKPARVTSGELIHRGLVPAQLQEGSSLPWGVELWAEEPTVVRLADGSTVELEERSVLTLWRRHDGTALELGAGDLIVEAAPQGRGHLYVVTDDCQVSVTGTVFSVSHGTRGSRVAVLEGEVKVRQAAGERVLRPGQQLTTRKALEPRPVAEEIAWSRHLDRYLALLSEVHALDRDLAGLPRPGLRFRSGLLDRLPATTVVYAAFPNLAGTLEEGVRRVRERLAASPALADWWQERAGGDALFARLEPPAALLGELGSSLEDEVAVAAWPDGAGGVEGPVILAELADPGAFRGRLQEAKDRQEELSGRPVFLVDDPSANGEPQDGLYVWLADGLVVASPELAALRTEAAVLAGSAPRFETGSFHQALLDRYGSGVEIVAGVDLTSLRGGDRVAGRLDVLGLGDAGQLFFEQRADDDLTRRDVVVTFDGPPTGILGWLGSPAPMGALRFLSPDTVAAVAAVVRDPSPLLLRALEADRGLAEQLASFEGEHGVDVAADLLAPLGREVAWAIDGPLLPTPSWKVVVEVRDRIRLQSSLERLVAEADQAFREAGRGGLTLSHEERDGTTVYRVSTEEGPGVSWVYDDGYLVVAPTAALIDRALRCRAAEYDLTASPRLRAHLPAGEEVDFSLLGFEDFGPVLASLSQAVGEGVELTAEQRQILDQVGSDHGPAVLVGEAGDRELRLAAVSDRSPLALLETMLLRNLSVAGSVE